MGFTFFILLLGALVFTLMQKHEIKSNKEFKQQTIRRAQQEAMGHGRDNIYQFKIYCYNMRCLLELAQKEGIGVGEERNEIFYDKHRDEISNKYCDGQEPTRWAMNKAIDTVMDQNYVSAWIFNSVGDEYYDEREFAHGIYKKRIKNRYTWSVCRSEYNRSIAADRIKGIVLPKDGKTKGEYILRALYNFNHSRDFEGVNSYKDSLDYFATVVPISKYDKSIPYFEESGITLYN